MNRSFVWRGFLLIPFVLACFALSPQARATCQEGCDLTNINTFLGNDALVNNATGVQNTAMGSNALGHNTTGFDNTAIGALALDFNTTGHENTAIGFDALSLNSTGSNNTASGLYALLFNTSGSLNTAVGNLALYSNGTGDSNTASGDHALNLNSTGSNNTASGAHALDLNTTGDRNTANGAFALENNTTGSRNIALGFEAGFNLTTGNDNIDIGNNGVADESSTIRIGTVGTQTATYIAGIRNTRLVHGAAVTVGITDDGQLGVRASLARFEEAIKPMDKDSEVIFSLQPVTFHYKKELDPAAVPQFGLVAEQVAEVDSDLVARDAEGKPYTVRYEEVNAMLLNEFLKEHKTVQEQGATIARLERQVQALTAGLQKVSAQLEASKSAPSAVVTNE